MTCNFLTSKNSSHTYAPALNEVAVGEFIRKSRGLPLYDNLLDMPILDAGEEKQRYFKRLLDCYIPLIPPRHVDARKLYRGSSDSKSGEPLVRSK